MRNAKTTDGKMTPEPTEAEVRKLRDKVFDDVIGDVSWSIVGKNWRRPNSVAWLREKSKRSLTLAPDKNIPT
jgi:hypothetical protein